MELPPRCTRLNLIETVQLHPPPDPANIMHPLRPVSLRARLVLSITLSLCIVSTSIAADPLHVKINTAIDASSVGPRGGLADDLAFLRRIHLDLTGRLPSSQEARAFLADKTADKRTKLVDRLLVGHEFSRHMAVVLDVMLMERRGGKHVKPDELRAWLRKQIETNRPYNELAAAFLSADGTPEKERESVAFYLERDVEPNLVTREVGRMFFGMDLQCAQCHNHPLIDDYHQADYFGLFAFVSRTSVYRPDAKKPALLQERAEGSPTFKSVFTARQAITDPRLPGSAEIAEPVFLPGQDYKAVPAKTVRGIPAFSRRDKLGELVRTTRNDFFERNITNRLWALMLGRGLVHPVDQHHSENPAAHPALMNLLCDEFVASKYDIKSFLREIALTDVYQRSHRLPADLSASVAVAKQAIPEFKAKIEASEKLVAAKEQAIELQLKQLDAALAAATPVRAAYEKVLKTARDAATKRAAAQVARDAKQAALSAKQPIADSVRSAVDALMAAAVALKGDKDLTATAAKLDAKAKKFEAEAAKLKTELATATKAATDAETALTEANKPVIAEQAKVAPVEQNIRDQRARMVNLRRELIEQRSLATHFDRRVKFLEGVVALDAAEHEIARLNSLIQQHQAAIPQAELDIAAATKQLTAMKPIVDAAKAALATATAEFNTAVQARATPQQGATLIGESLAKANETLAKLPNDADLKAVVAQLGTVQQRVAATVAEADKAVKTHEADVASKQSAMSGVTLQVQQFEKTLAERRQQLAKIGQDVVAAKQKIGEQQSAISESSDSVVQQAANQFNIAVLEPLTPDQIAWSVLRASGQYDNQLAASRAEINKKTPLKPEDMQDAAKVAARDVAVDENAYAKLNGIVAKFVGLFSGETGQPQDAFFATAEQALFFANGGEVSSWLAPSGENLTGRLLKLEDPKALTEELYVSVLTRLPTEEETRDVADYLDQRKADRKAAVTELAWALLTSAEFRFHH
ncbi:MAG: DUF1549 domain-containing protein [Planctomycetota bacterium]|nr:DUF1549 domain-containing protein [Planctomycetota bacterium]